MGAQVDLTPIDQAALDALATLDRPVGFGAAPADALQNLLNQANPGPDYLILYPVTDRRSGTLRDPYEDIASEYQVTIVGRMAEGVRWLIPRVEAALKAMVIPGRAVVTFVPVTGGGVRPDLTTTPPVFIATPSWRVWSTPNP